MTAAETLSRTKTDTDALLSDLKREFKSVSHIKPPASRKESPELYVIAKGFRGMSEEDERE